MKKYFFFLVFCALSFAGVAQVAQRIFPSQSGRINLPFPINFVFIDSLDNQKFYVADAGKIKWPMVSVVGLNDTMATRLKTANLMSTITANMGAAPVASNRTLTINGTGQDLSANRSWTLTTSDISEGTNLYWTTGRFDSRFSTKTTDDLTEGVKKYFTNALARSALSLTNLGTGSASYDAVNGVLNIPVYKPLAYTPTSLEITTALGFTPLAAEVDGSVTNEIELPAQSGKSGQFLTTDGTNPSWTANTSGTTINDSPGRLLSVAGSNTFVISSTKYATVRYVINIAYALTLQQSNGRVALQYTTDSGTTWKTASSASNVYLISVTLQGNNDYALTGEIPPNATVRLNVTNNSNVTITMPLTSQQEVLHN